MVSYYGAGTNFIKKYDTSWNTLVTNGSALTDSGIAGVDHCGAPVAVGSLLYVPMEVYPNSPYNNQWITTFNTSDLSFVAKYDISAQATEISGFGYNPADNLLYATSFVNGNVVLKYTLTGTYVGSISISPGLSSIQGITILGGYMYLSESATNSIHKLTLAGAYLGRVYNFSGFTEAEGLGNDGTYIMALAVDGSSNKNVYFLS